MPAMRRYIDPATGDYEIEHGGPKSDLTMASAVILRLRTQRGSMPGLPSFGSRIHTIQTISPANVILAESYAIEAVQDLVDRKAIRNVSAKAEGNGTRLTLTVSFTDANRRDHNITVTTTVGL